MLVQNIHPLDLDIKQLQAVKVDVCGNDILRAGLKPACSIRPPDTFRLRQQRAEPTKEPLNRPPCISDCNAGIPDDSLPHKATALSTATCVSQKQMCS